MMWFEDFGILQRRARYRRWLQSYAEVLKAGVGAVGGSTLLQRLPFPPPKTDTPIWVGLFLKVPLFLAGFKGKPKGKPKPGFSN